MQYIYLIRVRVCIRPKEPGLNVCQELLKMGLLAAMGIHGHSTSQLQVEDERSNGFIHTESPDCVIHDWNSEMARS